MIKASGVVRKMQAEMKQPLQYTLPLADKVFPLNQALGQKIHLEFSGKIFCVQCGRKTTKSFQQGHCYPCYQRLLECNLCILHPERCRVQSGQCPQDDWAHVQCHQSHLLYLANTSGLKVGVTRHNQLPTRWIDQGAIQAIPLLSVANRYQAGALEVACKVFVNDKTNWRLMLKNVVEPLDMRQVKQDFLQQCQAALTDAGQTFSEDIQPLDGEPLELKYPALEYPSKVSSLSFDKTPVIEGVLLGIKGQYLLLDHGVLNIRKFSGYELQVVLPS